MNKDNYIEQLEDSRNSSESREKTNNGSYLESINYLMEFGEEELVSKQKLYEYRKDTFSFEELKKMLNEK